MAHRGARGVGKRAFASSRLPEGPGTHSRSQSQVKNKISKKSIHETCTHRYYHRVCYDYDANSHCYYKQHRYPANGPGRAAHGAEHFTDTVPACAPHTPVALTRGKLT